MVRELIRKYRNNGLYTCFVDFKMAFDSIDRTLLFDKLEELPGMDPVWIRLSLCPGPYVLPLSDWTVWQHPMCPDRPYTCAALLLMHGSVLVH